MINLVIKDPKECNVMHNNRKKFSKTISILEGLTLQGETRDISGTVKRKGTEENGTWTPISILKIGQKMTGSNRVEDIGVGEQNKNKEQESRYNISHEPPDLDPSIEEERYKYEEVFHELDVMDTYS